MAVSFYQLSVPTYLQVVSAVDGFMSKAKEHFDAHGVDPESVVETRLFEDMLPFRFQILSVAHHSIGAIEGLEAGVFKPGGRDQSPHYADLHRLVSETRAALEALDPARVDALEGNHIDFVLGEQRIPFTATDFVQSFSMPNFFFHATTAYDILRHKGVPLGKRDFLGRMRIKR
ncbi:MAG: DUF1993 domain-containing protein [Burkholderiaceae bacterium]